MLIHLLILLKETKEFKKLLLVLLSDSHSGVLNRDLKKVRLNDFHNDLYTALSCEFQGV